MRFKLEELQRQDLRLETAWCGPVVPMAGGDGRVDREGLVCMKEGGL